MCLADWILTRHFNRLRLLEILNSGQYASPIIVFVNQKKTADMVAKDLSRAGVGAKERAYRTDFG